jgi:hypothetical protein
MEAQHSAYRYQPLDETRREIRLLRLLPINGAITTSSTSGGALAAEATLPDDLICCILSVASLHHEPDFEALSYVWGDTRPQVLSVSTATSSL